MKYFFITFLSLLVFGYLQCFSQIEGNVERVTENLVEDLAGAESPENQKSMLEDLHYFAENPLHINTASEDQLKRLHLLNEFQIQSLKDYINSHGRLVSIYELPYITGFTIEDAKRLEGFVTFIDAENEFDVFESVKLDDLIRYGSSRLLLRTQRKLEKPAGYLNENSRDGAPGSNYRGNIYRYYAKYRYEYHDRIQWGVTMEKDPGEEFFRGSNDLGFDFYSFHFLYRGKNWLRKLAVGDYQMNFGQGLVLWSGFSFSKSAMSTNVLKTGTGLDKYSSVNENRYFRGLALNSKLGKLNLTLFFSGKKVDANLSDDGDGKRFTTLQNTGYHRTVNEIRNESSIKETAFGGNITVSDENLKAGLTGLGYFHDGKQAGRLNLNRKFRSAGSIHYNMSFNYKYLAGRFYFYGEEAFNKSGGFAALNGVDCMFSSDISLSLLHRYYAKEYYAAFSSAFGENTRNSNEEGLYAGLNLKLLPSLTASLYFDSYAFPWLRYNIDAPSYGNDIFVDLRYSFNEKTSLYFRYKQDISQKNDDHITLSGLKNVQTSRYRLHFRSSLAEKIRWSNRIEFSDYKEEENREFGWLIYQDLRYTLSVLPLSFTIRYAFFDTESYASRIYAYEHDVLYAFSVPAYYSKGYRTYVNLHFNKSHFDVYCKIGQTKYMDKEKLGSGPAMIDGNTKTEVKLQMMLKF